MSLIINPYAFGAGGASAWVTAVTARSPLAWYRLGENSGNAINSGSVGSADMTPQNVGSLSRNVGGLITGDSNGAVSTASNGYFSLASIPGALNLSRSFTFAAWLRFTTTGIYHPVLVTGAALYVSNAQKLEFWQRGGGAAIGTGATTLSASTRYFVCLRVGAGGTASWSLDLNGSVDASGTTSTTFSSSDMYLMYDTFNQLRGTLDEALVFGSSLSNSDITALYNAGL